MNTKLTFAVLLFLFSYPTVCVAEEADEIRSWTNAAAETLFDSVQAMHKQGLVEKGMAESDVEAILQTYATNAAECLAAAIRAVSENEGVDFKLFVNAETPGYINPAELDKREFDRVAQACTLAALENAGIVVDR